LKSTKFAVTVLILLIVAITANSLYISHLTDKFAERIDGVAEDDTEKAHKELEIIFKDFRKAEKYISLTVSHDDLTNIEDCFSEIIGAAKAGSTKEIIIVKSRLRDSLEHLGRLSGFNLDSIL
jgi:hypothetical protein